MISADDWAQANEAYFDSMNASEILAVLAVWGEAARIATGRDDVEMAAPFQRHYTKLGTGLPPNFALVFHADGVSAHKFDPSNSHHPRGVHDSQIKGKAVVTWPQGSVRFGDTETGPLAYGMTLHVDGGKSIPCRTPKLPRNPASAFAVVVLGGELPT